ncbi:hypothetical protein JQ554_04595 [Bradyrhizobium diazoefficiens]|nr:hypothetical protein [Bradyrhizobium diazoefficiens]MBR0963374.1 hypothetical protein [Bradyrhizobium diazoefficiens]MBR0976188.1 hypothetical protein [Bradyrhizobium diazoefficiens]MBR1007036.1 hypothetical protein [Bradyrhizobium diazoefficiens]MBR1013147.1 hypothetical protein [Bradyrhizobium diazoefficiens]MBR1049967.1 hypothetical protein [Bradyrhizobium diazoefficiens]
MPIAADAAIAAGFIGEGRLIPLLILDTTERPDIEEFIRIHQYVRAGDVQSQWATIEDGSGDIGLLLIFEKPVALTVLIVFDIAARGVLVDQIIRTKGLYIQAGRTGDRFIHDTERPKVILELPDTGFGRAWEEIFYNSALRQFKRMGLRRSDAKTAASSYIGEWRKFSDLRIKSLPS